MSLSAIVQDIATALAAKNIIDAARVYEGAEHLSEHGDYPRVVFVPGPPGADVFGPTERAGGNPRQRATILEQYSVHCWAADFATVKALRNDVLAQCIDTAGGMSKDSLQFGTGGITQKTLHDQRGKEYVFVIRIAVPVLETTYQKVPSGTRAKHTGIMKFPGGDTIGCTQETEEIIPDE